jgi:hypothetical protein
MVSQSDAQSVLMDASSVLASNMCTIESYQINGGLTAFPLYKILSGDIKIKEGRGAGDASYDGKKNTITVSSTLNLSNSFDQALFVHECVHAAFDIGQVTVKVMLEEAIAYVTQCIILLTKTTGPLTFSRGQQIFDAAFVIARAANGQSKNVFTLADQEMINLINAIKSNPIYKARANAENTYDGV